MSDPSLRPRLGTTVQPTGTRFAVWAPAAETVELVLPGRGESVALPAPDAAGVRVVDVADAGHGERYAYSLDGGPPVPDPALSLIHI